MQIVQEKSVSNADFYAVAKQETMMSYQNL